jgi:hypothetical protein
VRGRFQVLASHVRLTTGTQAVEAVAGDLFTVPAEARTLDAVEDSALLLAVALSLGSPGLVALAPGAGPVYSWQEDWSRHAATHRAGARRGPRPDLAPDPR